jgi:hypothetical protein
MSKHPDVLPGDMFEWVYVYNSSPVVPKEQLWSTPLQRWVPIGGRNNLLIAITDEIIMWLSDKGLFSARADDRVPLLLDLVAAERLFSARADDRVARRTGRPTPKWCSTRAWMTFV